MRRFCISALALAAAACARSEDVPEEALQSPDSEVVAPIPEGVRDEPVSDPEPAVEAATWQAAERGEGTTLRLVTPDDTLLMSLACANVPRELVATVPGFVRVASDSRFILALGSAPVVLVADAATTSEGLGVIARAPVPETLDDQFGVARDITANYGAERLGPYALPEPTMVASLLRSCGINVPEAPASATPPE